MKFVVLAFQKIMVNQVAQEFIPFGVLKLNKRYFHMENQIFSHGLFDTNDEFMHTREMFPKMSDERYFVVKN